MNCGVQDALLVATLTQVKQIIYLSGISNEENLSKLTLTARKGVTDVL